MIVIVMTLLHVKLSQQKIKHYALFNCVICGNDICFFGSKFLFIMYYLSINVDIKPLLSGLLNE